MLTVQEAGVVLEHVQVDLNKGPLQQSRAKHLYLDAESEMLEVQDAGVVLEHFPVDLDKGPL